MASEHYVKPVSLQKGKHFVLGSWTLYHVEYLKCVIYPSHGRYVIYVEYPKCVIYPFHGHGQNIVHIKNPLVTDNETWQTELATVLGTISKLEKASYKNVQIRKGSKQKCPHQKILATEINKNKDNLEYVCFWYTHTCTGATELVHCVGILLPCVGLCLGQGAGSFWGVIIVL